MYEWWTFSRESARPNFAKQPPEGGDAAGEAEAEAAQEAERRSSGQWRGTLEVTQLFNPFTSPYKYHITCRIRYPTNMAAVTPFMSFLRPMGLPRPATVRQFMHFSTSTSCLAAREGM